MSKSSHWGFSPLSCSLMSLLASRTHEWQAWTLSEGGTGDLNESGVVWVELSLRAHGKASVIRCSDLAAGQALSVFEAVQKLAPNDTTPEQNGWNLIWTSDKFLSQVETSALPALKSGKEWMLSRGSAIKPSLYSKL